MLAFDNVTKQYRMYGVTKTILDNISIIFPTDKSLAIMGKNGAGKSTLMRLLAGTELPSSGNIYRSIKLSWPLGFSGGFNGSMTGIENIRFIARVYGQDSDYVTDYVKEFSELDKSLRLPIRTYSSGMKARLAFGLSLAIDFKIYLIDEITAVGDRNFRKKSNSYLKNKLKDSHVIMVSHSEKTIHEYCQAGYLLDNNSLIYYDNIKDLIKAYNNL